MALANYATGFLPEASSQIRTESTAHPDSLSTVQRDSLRLGWELVRSQGAEIQRLRAALGQQEVSATQNPPIQAPQIDSLSRPYSLVIEGLEVILLECRSFAPQATCSYQIVNRRADRQISFAKRPPHGSTAAYSGSGALHESQQIKVGNVSHSSFLNTQLVEGEPYRTEVRYDGVSRETNLFTRVDLMIRFNYGEPYQLFRFEDVPLK